LRCRCFGEDMGLRNQESESKEIYLVRREEQSWLWNCVDLQNACSVDDQFTRRSHLQLHSRTAFYVRGAPSWFGSANSSSQCAGQGIPLGTLRQSEVTLVRSTLPLSAAALQFVPPSTSIKLNSTCPSSPPPHTPPPNLCTRSVVCSLFTRGSSVTYKAVASSFTSLQSPSRTHS
jgi:hypothetical protein